MKCRLEVITDRDREKKGGEERGKPARKSREEREDRGCWWFPGMSSFFMCQKKTKGGG